MIDYKIRLKNVFDDPSVRNWTKEILVKLQEHDPVDVIHDCELLLTLAKHRLYSTTN